MGLVGISLATAISFGFGAYWAADIMEVLVLEEDIGERARRSARAIAAGESPTLPNEDWYYARFQSDGNLHPALGQLQSGSHHDVFMDDREFHVWVEPVRNDRLFLIYDLTRIEAFESQLVVFLVSICVIVGVLAVTVGLWITKWVAQPVADLAHRVLQLPSDAPQLGPLDQEDADLAIVAGAIDVFLAKNHELMERERAFSGMASHELRNPVATITAALDVMDLRSPSTNSVQPLARIRRATQRIDRLIEVLLDLARRESRHDGGMLCHPAAVVREILDDHAARSDGHGRLVDVELDDTLELPVKPAMFEVVAENLISNALNHSTGPKILIRLDVSAFTVRSEGGSANDNGGGGLGLSIVDVICGRLGWQFYYETDGPFTVARVRLA